MPGYLSAPGRNARNFPTTMKSIAILSAAAASLAGSMMPINNTHTHEIRDYNYSPAPLPSFLPTSAQANRPALPSGRHFKKNLRRQVKQGLRRTPSRYVA